MKPSLPFVSLRPKILNYKFQYAGPLHHFSEFVLNNSTVIKTFDLTKNSKIGKYLRKHIDDPNGANCAFPYINDGSERYFARD